MIKIGCSEGSSSGHRSFQSIAKRFCQLTKLNLQILRSNTLSDKLAFGAEIFHPSKMEAIKEELALLLKT